MYEKVIKCILIRGQVEISRTCIYEKRKLKDFVFGGLWKYNWM